MRTKQLTAYSLEQSSAAKNAECLQIDIVLEARMNNFACLVLGDSS